MNIYSGSSVPLNLPGMVITALVIAGGGSGVNNLLVSLGFRSVKTDQRMTPKPPPTQAWVSVRLIRKSAKGLVNVLIGPVGGVPQVAGSISGSSSGNSLYRFFLRDWGRFPTAGGHILTPGQPIEIKLEGVDATGKKVASESWGPYALTAGALVDIELTL